MGGIIAEEVILLRGGQKDGETMAIRSDVNDLEFMVRTRASGTNPSTRPVRAIYRRNMEAHAKGGHVFDFAGYSKSKLDL